MSPIHSAAGIQRETVALAKQLIACRSLTPDDAGTLAIIEARLAPLGFRCERIERGGVSNLWAEHGSGEPSICLAGHVDVVSPGPLSDWSSDPFSAVERDGHLVGRGATIIKIKQKYFLSSWIPSEDTALFSGKFSKLLYVVVCCH